MSGKIVQNSFPSILMFDLKVSTTVGILNVIFSGDDSLLTLIGKKTTKIVIVDSLGIFTVTITLQKFTQRKKQSR